MSNPAAIPTLPEWAADNEDMRLPVSREEIEARRDAVFDALVRDGIDVAVFTTAESIYYLTGVELWRSNYEPLIMSAGGNHRMLCRLIDMGWHQVWRDQTWASEWIAYRDHEDKDIVVADAVRAVHRGDAPLIAFELERTSVSHESIRRTAESVGAAGVTSCTRMVEDLRVVKSPAEQDLMRRAGLISIQMSEAVVEAIRAGKTDVEAAKAANNVAIDAGGMAAPWPAMVMTGAAAGTGHMAWSRRAPEPGEAVTWYVSGFARGYGCPIERTIVRLPDTRNVMRLRDGVIRAVEALKSELRPGMTSSQGYDIAMKAHRASGLDEHWLNHAGYGIGIQWTEFDLFRLRAGDDRVLQPGVALHLVPCLTVPGLTNAHASSAVVMTEDGVAPLYEYPFEIDAFE